MANGIIRCFTLILELQDLRRVSSLGHCNGIFCLEGSFNANSLDSSFEETILWNPATREVKVLSLTPPAGEFFQYFGFGASDPDTFDHFNFIHIYVDDTVVVYVKVYNINTDSWILILHMPLRLILMGSITGCLLTTDYTYILCFDFHCNKFRKINTPSTMSFSTILEAHDSIAYLVYEIEIWNFKQYSTWVKLCNFEPLDPYILIRAIWKDGTEFLGASEYHVLTLYNSRAQPLRQLEISPEYEFHIYPYVENIAPLSL